VWHLSTCQTSGGTGQGGNILSSGPVVLFCYKPTRSTQTQTTISHHDTRGQRTTKKPLHNDTQETMINCNHSVSNHAILVGDAIARAFDCRSMRLIDRLDESRAFTPSTKPHSLATCIQAFAWHAAPTLAVIHPSTLENYHGRNLGSVLLEPPHQLLLSTSSMVLRDFICRRLFFFIDPRCNRILLLVWHSLQPCHSSCH